MGGLSGVLGHLEICKDVKVGAHTLITKSISESGRIYWNYASTAS